MRSFSFVATLGFLVLCITAIASAGEGSSPIAPSGSGMEKVAAARVNGVEITMESVATMMTSLGTKQGHATASPESMEETRKDAMSQLILQELAYQSAKSEGLAVERKEIDVALADLKGKLGSEEKFREFLEKERITEEEVRKRIERNLTLKRVFAKEVQGKVSVSEEETRKEYERDKERYARKEKITVTDVVFFLETGEADSRKKAEEILRRIHDDKEKNPWNLVSGGVFAVRDLELRESQEKELYAVAKNLKVGELSDVFSAAGNLHVIKLKEYSPGKQFTFEEVRRGVEGTLRTQALKKRLEQWEVELKRDAKIEIMEMK